MNRSISRQSHGLTNLQLMQNHHHTQNCCQLMSTGARESSRLSRAIGGGQNLSFQKGKGQGTDVTPNRKTPHSERVQMGNSPCAADLLEVHDPGKVLHPPAQQLGVPGSERQQAQHIPLVAVLDGQALPRERLLQERHQPILGSTEVSAKNMPMQDEGWLSYVSGAVRESGRRIIPELG